MSATLDWLVARPIAHRGLHDATNGVIENTLQAAEAAVEGRFAIECDVQVTRDGEAVVFHDDGLDRLTAESGPVRERSATALTTLGIRGSSSRIPSLRALLDRIAGRVPLVVEIKSRFDGDLTLTRRTLELLSGYAGPVAVKSFDPAVIAAVAQAAPELTRGIVAAAHHATASPAAADDLNVRLGHLLHWRETRPHFLSWHVGDLPHAAPFLCRTLAGVPVMTWTVRTPAERERAARHADQIVFEGFRPET